MQAEKLGGFTCRLGNCPKCYSNVYIMQAEQIVVFDLAGLEFVLNLNVLILQAETT